jgi:hypothetical protein
MENKNLIIEKICFYCGTLLLDEKKVKFCCNEHRAFFENAKRAGRKISIKINDKTTIFTDKYDIIPTVVAKQKEFINSPVRFTFFKNEKK